MKITTKLTKMAKDFTWQHGQSPTRLHISTTDAVQVRRFGIKVEVDGIIMGMRVASIGGITKVEA